MRARSFLAVVGLFALAGCGGDASTSGISVASGPRDLGGFVVPSQSGSTDAATTPAVDGGAAAPDLSTSGGSCGSIDTSGVCQGDTLEYCTSSGTLKTKNCSSSGESCSVSSSGYASCK